MGSALRMLPELGFAHFTEAWGGRRGRRDGFGAVPATNGLSVTSVLVGGIIHLFAELYLQEVAFLLCIINIPMKSRCFAPQITRAARIKGVL